MRQEMRQQLLLLVATNFSISRDRSEYVAGASNHSARRWRLRAGELLIALSKMVFCLEYIEGEGLKGGLRHQRQSLILSQLWIFENGDLSPRRCAILD